MRFVDKASKSNPALFGEDMTGLAAEAVGVGITAVAHDKITKPLALAVMPGVLSTGLVGKLVDAALTTVTGYLASEAVGLVAHNLARPVKRGAMVLAVGKALTAPIGGPPLLAGSLPFQIPSFSIPSLTSGTASAPALPAGTAYQTATAARPAENTRLGVGSMGL